MTVSAAKAKAIRALTKPKLKVAYDLVDVAGNDGQGHRHGQAARPLVDDVALATVGAPGLTRSPLIS